MGELAEIGKWTRTGQKEAAKETVDDIRRQIDLIEYQVESYTVAAGPDGKLLNLDNRGGALAEARSAWVLRLVLLGTLFHLVQADCEVEIRRIDQIRNRVRVLVGQPLGN